MKTTGGAGWSFLVLGVILVILLMIAGNYVYPGH